MKTFSFWIHDIYDIILFSILACSQGSDFGTGRGFGRGTGGRMGGGRGFGDSLSILISTCFQLIAVFNTNMLITTDAEVWQGWSGKHPHKAMYVTDARCLVC